MSWTLIVLYALAAIAAAMALYRASGRHGDGARSAAFRATLSTFGGALWPILLLGVIQLAAVAMYAKSRERPTVEFVETPVDLLA